VTNSIVIQLLGRSKFVDPLKNSIDPRRSEFSAQAIEITNDFLQCSGLFDGKNAIYVVFRVEDAS